MMRITIGNVYTSKRITYKVRVCTVRFFVSELHFSLILNVYHYNSTRKTSEPSTKVRKAVNEGLQRRSLKPRIVRSIFPEIPPNYPIVHKKPGLNAAPNKTYRSFGSQIKLYSYVLAFKSRQMTIHSHSVAKPGILLNYRDGRVPVCLTGVLQA